MSRDEAQLLGTRLRLGDELIGEGLCQRIQERLHQDPFLYSLCENSLEDIMCKRCSRPEIQGVVSSL
jgi:hypothetical protein